MRSLENWNRLAKQIKKLDKQIAEWYADKIQLNHSQHKELFDSRLKLSKDLKEACPHDQCVICRGTYTDVGYGCDRYYTHYDVQCKRCNEVLINNTCDTQRRAITEPLPLVEAVIALQKYERVSEDDLMKFGIRKQTYTTHTTKYIVDGKEYTLA